MSEPQGTILVADDDPDFLEAMRLVLEAHGFHVVTAADSDECLAQIAAQKPDLLILDMMMDRMAAGVSVGLSLRSKPETAEIPILLVSSMPSEKGLVPDGEVPMEFADRYLPKPIDPDRLLQTVRQLTHRN